MLLVLSAGYFRQQGVASAAALLPFENANSISWNAAVRHVLPRVPGTPVFLGICAQDPDLDLERFLANVRSHGMAGVTNFPSVGFMDGRFRQAVEAAGLGYEREVRLIETSRRAGLLTIAFCLSPGEARRMAEAGAHILCLDLGFAEPEGQGASEHQAALDRAVRRIDDMIRSAREVVANPYTVAFGGPVVLPQDAAQIFQRTDVLGYIGGSAVERYPAAPMIRQTVREFREVTLAGRREDRLGALIGTSPAMRDLLDTIRKVARSPAPVLLVGESGTGKELVAREVHRLSARAGGPLVTWNCGATTEPLAMSELFGHEKGAFTGASRSHLGRFEAAHGGTLFMDEVADLPAAVQASLLRVLQEGEIVRVGGERTLQVDVRLIAATNTDLRGLIEAGRFRLDLYFRLSTVILRLPPLRERREDLPLLVAELAEEFSRAYGCSVPRFPDSALEVLRRHAWPGNIRELRNVVERCFILGPGRTLSPAWLEDLLGSSVVPAPSGTEASRPRERLSAVLARHGGNKSAAARELGVTRKTVYNWLSRG